MAVRQFISIGENGKPVNVKWKRAGKRNSLSRLFRGVNPNPNQLQCTGIGSCRIGVNFVVH